TGPVAIDAAKGSFAGVDFVGSASAGSSKIELANLDSLLSFRDTSSAGTAMIGNAGHINFYDETSAGAATIANNDGATAFNGNSTAGNASISLDGEASVLDFYNDATAGNATITNTAGLIRF